MMEGWHGDMMQWDSSLMQWCGVEGWQPTPEDMQITFDSMGKPLHIAFKPEERRAVISILEKEIYTPYTEQKKKSLSGALLAVLKPADDRGHTFTPMQWAYTVSVLESYSDDVIKELLNRTKGIERI